MSGGAENLPAQQNDISASAKTSGLRFPNRNYNDDWTRTLDAFETLSTLGEGTFGYVLNWVEATSKNLIFCCSVVSNYAT